MLRTKVLINALGSLHSFSHLRWIHRPCRQHGLLHMGRHFGVGLLLSAHRDDRRYGVTVAFSSRFSLNTSVGLRSPFMMAFIQVANFAGFVFVTLYLI